MNYILRYDIPSDEWIDKIKEWLEEVAFGETVFCVEENPKGTNRHLHAMFRSDIERKSLASKFTYRFRESAQDTKYYSITTKEGLLKYLCKGPLAISKIKDKDYPGTKKFPIVLVQGSMYSNEDIKEAHEQWWKDAKEWKIKKVEKEQKLPEIEQMLKYVEKLRLRNGKLSLDYDLTKLEDDIIDYYIDHRKTIRYSMMIEYVDTIWLILMKTHERKEAYAVHRLTVRERLSALRFKKF